MTVSASAPGKVVLSGEYAVLTGAPAICMAVDRRAVAEVGSGAPDEPPSTLVESVMKATGSDTVPNCDTRAFATQAGEKLGLGSSAALTVAMLAAIEGEKPDLERAIEIHREWQGGKGSGVDIACSIHGGLIEYSMQGAQVSQLEWPEGLEFRLLWTGASSSTGEKLAKLENAEPSKSAERLAAEAGNVADAWRSGAAVPVLSSYVDYIEALRAFSVDHGLGIFDAGHDEIVDAAIAANIIYKPCGAGGGDVGIALSNDGRALDVFVWQLGLRLVDCALDPEGVVITRS